MLLLPKPLPQNKRIRIIQIQSQPQPSPEPKLLPPLPQQKRSIKIIQMHEQPFPPFHVFPHPHPQEVADKSLIVEPPYINSYALYYSCKSDVLKHFINFFRVDNRIYKC